MSRLAERIIVNDLTGDMQYRDELIVRLRNEPVAYRRVLNALDPEFRGHIDETHEYRLVRIGNLPLILTTYEEPDAGSRREQLADLLIWDEPSSPEAGEIGRFVREREGVLSQILMLGEKAFGTLRPCLTEGAWRLSRNYELTQDRFIPRPSGLVRPLTPEDRQCVDKAIETYEIAKHHSTIRDFDQRAGGRRCKCWGAFVDNDLVGFVSTNPIFTGVTEISWIFTAEPFRRRGIAAGLLTAACEDAFSRGDAVGYHAGGAGDDLDRMVHTVGFRKALPTYRFIPVTSKLQWLTGWGLHV